MKTKTARISAIAFSALLMASAIGIFTPSAMAQNEQPAKADTAVKNPFTDTLLPDAGIATLNLETAVTMSTASGCIVPVTVTWNQGNVPSYATVVFQPSSQTQNYKNQQTNQAPLAPTGDTIVFRTTVTITITRDAPAYKDDRYEFIAKTQTGTTSTGCNVKAPEDSKAYTTIKNGYFPLTSIEPTSLFVKAGQNKKVVFPVNVVNLGNGPTRVKIDLTPAGKNRLDSMNAGAEIRLETKAGKGASAQFRQSRNIEVQTPHSNGYTNSIYSFNAKFTSSYDGPTTGTPATDETSVTFSVQVQGVYVPGPDPMAIIVALGIGLVAMSRLRRSG